MLPGTPPNPLSPHITLIQTTLTPPPSTRTHADVNVLSWNRLTSYMLASGADDGTLRIWDLRNFKQGEYVANFGYHKG